MIDVMIDTETLDTRPSAVIIAIGATFFEPLTGKLGKTWYREIDLKDAMAKNRTVCADTITWWMKQSNIARNIFTGDIKKESLKDTLLSFTKFVQQDNNPRNIKLWANDPAFDTIKLQENYIATGISWPFEFWNNRCCRTIKCLYPNKLFKQWLDNNPRVGAHNALDDAIYQVQYISHIFKELGCEELY